MCFQPVVLIENDIVKQRFLAGIDILLRLFQGAAVGFVVVDIDVKMLKDQIDDGIFPARSGLMDDRAKKGNPVDQLQQHLHDPEHYGGFAASLLRRRYVQVCRHDVFV